MKIDIVLIDLKNKIKEREILKNCCRQKWATNAKILHWKNGIKEYDVEISYLCEKINESEYYLIKELKININ